MIDVKVQQDVTAKVEAMKAAIRASVPTALHAAGQVVEAAIVNKIVEGMKGTPSRPGEPPHSQRGNMGLKGSWATTIVGPEHVEVSSSLTYSKYLEYGTSELAPRPYVHPAINESRSDAAEAFSATVADAIEKVGV